MENFLRSKEYWHLVEHGIRVVPNKANATKVEIKQLIKKFWIPFWMMRLLKTFGTPWNRNSKIRHKWKGH